MCVVVHRTLSDHSTTPRRPPVVVVVVVVAAAAAEEDDDLTHTTLAYYDIWYTTTIHNHNLERRYLAMGPCGTTKCFISIRHMAGWRWCPATGPSFHGPHTPPALHAAYSAYCILVIWLYSTALEHRHRRPLPCLPCDLRLSLRRAPFFWREQLRTASYEIEYRTLFRSMYSLSTNNSYELLRETSK